ncbi:serine/threonine-protein kinase [Amycolatopsis sp. CA-230715]|uniref:serine/threonine-protein kinase n=1 Tax=Amycolatopsis sp. CA-230715 TaxID=2745196 RepID=UPI001C029C7E|nr:serine/threonine-protein kinase [Amycolatopsis sp. CA-230715]QWF81612.1 Serine/threonine-protein kinase PknD [Amycolatopsis sp. CA-230715]
MTGDVSGDLTGRRLGNYRIDGVLGKGGMSVTYKATDVRLGRKVALKVIGEHLGADAEFRERFVDEARNTSAIDHANVVPLYDFGELDGMLYIAMRMVDGGDLAGLIANSPMDPDRALRLLDQVADALDSLHHRGLVHLDVKPANVLVTSRESTREHVYVADFGLTRRGATGHRTRGGDFLGSPTYAAPEHLRGEPLDGRTDQYALACVLYACLTGRPPFSGDVQTVIKGHLAGDPPPVSRQVSLPPGIDDVIRKGMAKNPADRYENCGELITAARKAISARQETGPEQRGGRAGAVAAVGEGASRAEGGQMNNPYGQQPGYGQQGQQPGQQGYPPQGTPPQGPPPQGSPPGYGGPQQGYPRQGGYPPQGLGQPPQGMPQQSQPHGLPQGPPPGQAGFGGPQQGQPGQQPPGYGPPPGFGGQQQQPSEPGFGEAKKADKVGKATKWVWVAVGAVVVAAAVVFAIIYFGSDDKDKGPATPSAPQTTAPQIPVGPSGGAKPSTSSGSQLPPPPGTVSVRPST